VIFQPPKGFKIAKNMIKINSIVGISLIILKYFELDVFLSSLNAFKHDPR
tara:strand:+ start:578 stop:727 length:150 start_codon:yes stop_codon:yes gene_type:complete